MKIAVLGTRGFPGIQGGVEAHCEQLYPRLVARNCEVVVFTRRPYVHGANGVYRGVRLIPLACPKHKYLEALLHSLVGVLHARKLSPDLLHIHAVGPSLVAPLARWLGMQVIVTNHGPDYQRKKWGVLAKAILRLGEHLGTRWAHQVICISEAIAADLRRKYNARPVVIPNGVEMPQRVDSQEALLTYGLESRQYILAVGRFVPEKGFHDLIEAFGRLQTVGSDGDQAKWKLVIVGRADHEDRYSRRVKERASKIRNVILTGFLTEKPLAELYSHAGLFALSSSYEGLPLVLLEAMSYGLPCVVSDLPSTRDVGLPEECYVRPGDVQALAAKLDERMRTPLGLEARRAQISQIAEGYSWETIADRTLEVYQSVLRNGWHEAT